METSRLRFLLDTNALSDLVKRPGGAVATRIAAVQEATICTSVVAACELRFGAKKRGSATLSAQVEAVLGAILILPVEADVTWHYADIRARLEAAGLPIGANDLLIAAHARSRDLTVVTDNLSEFSRVPGLAVENWQLSRH